MSKINGAPFEFLQQLRPAPWLLNAICPTTGKIVGDLVRNEKEVAAFVTRHEGKSNIYYSVNPTKWPLASKARKAREKEITRIEYVLADLDPKDNETPEAAKKRYLHAIEKFQPKPTFIVDSGNGFQVLWKLVEPLPIERMAEAKAASQAVMLELGGKAGTQNIDRILRLPGTTNLPNKTKLKKGRKRCLSALIGIDKEASCILDDFAKRKESSTALAPASSAGRPKLDWQKVEKYAAAISGPDDLPPTASEKLRTIVASDGELEALNDLLQDAGKLTKRYASMSEVSFALAASLKRTGLPPDRVAAWLIADLSCNDHITKIDDPVKRRRAVERLLNRSHDPTEPMWDLTKNGAIRPTMHNAKLAIAALGVECRRDLFHLKTLVRCHDVSHELRTVAGELSDDTIIGLRDMIKEHFDFDPESTATRDAVQSISLKNCFDPVLDFLAEAQGKWDGNPRLDTMAPNYFKCANTPLNRATFRKVMIAAVRRARVPGCKFDTILVLESKEGWNKSGALRVLAGDDNFNDEPIFGKGSREVQEQLSGVWIHENSDLAGMKRADVDQMKAFASRQVDKARAAYGHVPEARQRRSIEVATTNNDNYLQSQTGNRRFWPVRVLEMINLDELCRDRTQLWGEAAHYESLGEAITLDEELWPDAEAEQEKRRHIDPWEVTLAHIPDWVSTAPDGLTKIKIVYSRADRDMVATASLLTHVLKIPIGQQTASHPMRLALVMKRLGWEKDSKLSINKKQVRGYWRSAFLG